jgi:uncharacterized membrane protein
MPTMRFRVRFGLTIATLVAVILTVFVAVLLSSPLLKPDAAHMDPLSMVFSMIGLFAVFFVVIVILALAISAITWGQWLGDFKEHPTTDQILDERYAKGEIGYTEYLMLKQNIEIARRK